MLRNRLSEMTRLEVPVDEHPARFAELAGEFAHTIALRPSEYPLDQYTCGVHAFYLVGDETYIEVATAGLGFTFAGPDFIRFLLEGGLLQPREDGEEGTGDLVIYLEQGQFRHVGRVVEPGRILSKWGKGCLWEHGVWEVPSTYGEELRYYVGPDEQESYDLFIQYAESRGFNFGPPEV